MKKGLQKEPVISFPFSALLTMKKIQLIETVSLDVICKEMLEERGKKLNFSVRDLQGQVFLSKILSIALLWYLIPSSVPWG